MMQFLQSHSMRDCEPAGANAIDAVFDLGPATQRRSCDARGSTVSATYNHEPEL